MNKNSRIIIIGFGSIGQRHYRNLLDLGYKNVYVYDVDRKKIADSDYKKIANLSVSELKQFRVAFICNPNHEHVITAIKCAQAGCHLFIEKPLSHNLVKIDKLMKICQVKKLITMVGCNMRFHPCLKFIKNYLDEKRLGKVYSITHEFGSYLPYWRPQQDYRQNYAAKKTTGGGIILDDIHEFDLLFWLNDFSEISKSKFIFDKISDLKIKTEDICLAAFKFKNKVLGLVRCDYLQQSYSRNCKIVGEKGNLEWDFKENIVWLKNDDGAKKLFKARNFDFNNVYIDEAKYFLDCLNRKIKTFNDISRAKKVLEVCYRRK